VITQPAEGDVDDDVIDGNQTDYSRRLIIENLSTKQVVLPLKVPKVFKEVVFEKVKLKKDPVEEISVIDANNCVNGEHKGVDVVVNGVVDVSTVVETPSVQPDVRDSTAAFDEIAIDECFRNSELGKPKEKKIVIADIPPEPAEQSPTVLDFPVPTLGLKRQESFCQQFDSKILS